MGIKETPYLERHFLYLYEIIRVKKPAVCFALSNRFMSVSENQLIDDLSGLYWEGVGADESNEKI